uniref:SJCHGC08404 protein n=1 Tax=Schistosoma japonicum TaxID=6182 RepID=Q5DHN5_SCHJA|nr:SJCHGC08404 protein [Schistosoma japonicum]
MGKKVVHDIAPYFFIHNSSPPINLHPQHLAIIFKWGRRLCTTLPPIFSSTTHHRQSTYTHNISPSFLNGEEGCARHCPLFFHPQLITANQLTPTTFRHHF